MTTADQIAIVDQTLLGGDEKATVFADGGLVKDWKKSQRLVVIVTKKETSNALFIYNVKTLPLANVLDLSVDSIVPIDENFKCDIDSSNDVVYLNITGGHNKSKLILEMVQGFHTQNLVAEIFRLSEDNNRANLHFEWIDKYLPQDNHLSGKMDMLAMDQPTSMLSSSKSLTSLGDSANAEDMNRQDIASGAVAPIVARESVFKYQMALKEEQYTEIQQFVIFCGTWNVNGQSPPEEVTPWLAADQDPPDIYAIGFQELDLSTEAFVFNESPREEEWLRVVYKSLHPKAKYRKARLIRLVGMMMIVFVKEEHASYVKNIAA